MVVNTKMFNVKAKFNCLCGIQKPLIIPQTMLIYIFMAYINLL